MNRQMTLSACATLGALTAACGGASPSLKTGMSAIERDVQETTPVTLSDLDPSVVKAWSQAHRGAASSLPNPSSMDDLAPHDRIKEEIQWGQCQGHTANPLVPVVSGAFSLALQGSFSWGGSAGGSEGSTGPGATLGLTFTVNKQQGVTVPVTFVTAANLSTFYMSQMLAMFANTGVLSNWPPAGSAKWPTPAPLPQAPAPTAANAQMAIGSVTAPPAPDSQLARIQSDLERIIQTRDAIQSAALDAIRSYPPSSAFCEQFKKNGFVPVVYPMVE